MSHARPGLYRLAIAVRAAIALASPAAAADTLNASSLWPENWARPMLQEEYRKFKRHFSTGPSEGQREQSSPHHPGSYALLILLAKSFLGD
jgi:hypothetical protein